MDAELTVYEKRTCTTCRTLAALLEERGVAFDRVEYHVEGLDEATLRGLLRDGGLQAQDVLRAREPLAKELRLAEEPRDEDDLVALMVEHPELVQRPLVRRGDRVVLGRPPERVLELLD